MKIRKLLVALFCMGFLQTSAQKMDWYSLWGSSTEGSHIRAGKMAIDSEENVYTVAQFSGNAVTLEGQNAVSAQEDDLGDAILVKMASSHQMGWIKTFAKSGNVKITDVLTDSEDHIIVGGVFTDVISVDGQELKVSDKFNNALNNGFISRFNKNGELVNQWNIPTYGINGSRLAIDVEDKIYVAGVYGGEIQLGMEEYGDYSLEDQLFLTKFTTSGEVEWSKVTVTPDCHFLNAVIEVDLNGDLYIGGTFEGDYSFAGDNLTSQGSDMFICKYNRKGEEVWIRQISGLGEEVAVDLVLSPLGDVALGGTFTSNSMTVSGVDTPFTYPHRTGNSLPHMAVNTFTKDGDYRWQYWHGYSTSAEAVLTSLRCTDEGIYYLSGYVSGRAADISTGTVVAGVNSGIVFADGQHISHNTNGGADAVYLVLSPEGKLCNYARPGGVQTEKLADVVVSPDRKSVYFLLDLCVRAAATDIPLDNLFVSFTDINAKSKQDDFTMITLPCPEETVTGSYGSTYAGKFFSTCLLRLNFPEINPTNELSDYVSNTVYSHTFTMNSPDGEPLFISLNLPEEFDMTDGHLLGTPIGDDSYSITVIASDKTPRYSYFTPYAGDTSWDATYGGETTRGNNRNIRNFIVRPMLSWTGEETDPILSGNWNVEVFNGFDFDYGCMTTLDLTGVINLKELPTMNGVNPNFLIYTDISQRISGSNIVKFVAGEENGNASLITLTDGNDFHNRRGFNAESVSYKRDFSNMSGWASICLPFLADMSAYEIREFATTEVVNEGGESVTRVSFTTTDNYVANSPYLIRVDEAMGELTFNGVSVDGMVQVPATSLLAEERDGVVFRGNYREIGKGDATDLYLLYTDGSKFGKGVENSYVTSFRAYIEDMNGRGATYFAIDSGGNTTDLEMQSKENGWNCFSANGVLTIYTGEALEVTIRTIDGRRVGIFNLESGDNYFENLEKGIYLVNNHKVIVK